MKKIGEPVIQYIGAHGGFHLLKVSYPIWDCLPDADSTPDHKLKLVGHKGVVLKIRPDDLWDIPLSYEFPHFIVDPTKDL